MGDLETLRKQEERMTATQTIPFWEASYARPGRLDTFGNGKPAKDVVEVVSRMASRLHVGLSALDLGCGEGRNALYLAQCGFTTTAIDISSTGIEKLNTVAAERQLPVAASVGDMREFVFDHPYDLIVCLGCLHLIFRHEWERVLDRMQAATASNGYHVVGAFTDEVPEPEDQRGLMVGLFHEGELFERYRGWEMLKRDSYAFEHKHPDGPLHQHAGNSLIARKF
jgi:tellurite methyltransferase